jgi:hypothetical protein
VPLGRASAPLDAVLYADLGQVAREEAAERPALGVEACPADFVREAVHTQGRVGRVVSVRVVVEGGPAPDELALHGERAAVPEWVLDDDVRT